MKERSPTDDVNTHDDGLVRHDLFAPPFKVKYRDKDGAVMPFRTLMLEPFGTVPPCRRR